MHMGGQNSTSTALLSVNNRNPSFILLHVICLKVVTLSLLHKANGIHRFSGQSSANSHTFECERDLPYENSNGEQM